MIATANRGAIKLWDFEGSGYRGIARNEPSPNNGGNDAWEVAEAAKRIVAYLRETATWQKETLHEAFARHAETWRSETAFMSSIRDKATHPSYQRIIGMGSDALPLIIRELRDRPDHWFWALKAITRTDPVSPCDRGKLERMRDTWIAWADANGITRL